MNAAAAQTARNKSEFNFRHEGDLTLRAKRKLENQQVIKFAKECANYDQAEALKLYQKMRKQQQLEIKIRNRDAALFHYDRRALKY